MNSETVIDNEVLDNENLSLYAKGLYCTLQRCLQYADHEDTFKHFMYLIEEENPEEVKKAWEELQVMGYVSEDYIFGETGALHYLAEMKEGV